VVSPSPCPSPPGERGLINGIITNTPSPLKGEGWGGGESPMILSNYDKLQIPDVIGTVGGDDTLLVVLKESSDRESFIKRLRLNSAEK